MEGGPTLEDHIVKDEHVSIAVQNGYHCPAVVTDRDSPADTRPPVHGGVGVPHLLSGLQTPRKRDNRESSL